MCRLALRALPVLPIALAILTVAPAALRAQPASQPFRWAGDPEGGAPYVEASPDNPDELVGFDVEIADCWPAASGARRSSCS